MADVILTAAMEGFEGIAGKFADLQDALSTSEGRVAAFTKVAGSIATALASVGAAGIAAATVFIDTADELSKMSQKVGLSTEELSKLKYAADFSGVGIQGLQTGLIKMANTVNDAASGSDLAGKAFTQLGISISDSSGHIKSNDVLLKEVADKFKSMPDGIQKTAAAVDIFGKAGADLIPLLNGGAEGLADMGAEAEAFGAVISTEAGKSAEEFNDNLARLKGAFNGLINIAIKPIIPLITSLSTELVKVVRESEALKIAGNALTVAFKGILTAALILKNGLDNIIDTIVAMGKAMYHVSRGEFKQAWTDLKKGGDDVLSNYKDVAAGIEKIWSNTAKGIAEDSEKSTKAVISNSKEIAKQTKQTQKEIDAAVKTRGENEYFVQNQINEGWKKYYDSLAKNDEALQKKIEQNQKERAEKEVALSIEINNGWIAYYDNLSKNEEAKNANTKSGLDSLKGSFTEWFDYLAQKNRDIFKNIGDALTDVMQYGTQQIGTGVAAWIVEGKKFDLMDVFKKMAEQFIAQLITMTIQWGIFVVAQQAGWVSVGAAGAASGVAVNVAWLPITATVLAIAAAVVATIYVFENWEDTGVKAGAAIAAAIFPIAIPIVTIIALIKEWDNITAFASKSMSKAWEILIWPFQKMYDLIKLVIDGMKTVLGLMGGGIGGALDWLDSSTKGLQSGAKSVGSWIDSSTKGLQSGVSSGVKSIGKALGFASGGEFLTSGPRLIMVGEAGQEKVSVKPAGTFNSEMSGSRIVMNFNAPMVFDEISARRFARIQDRYAKGRTI